MTLEGKHSEHSEASISSLRKYLPQILAVTVKNVLLFDFGLSLGFPTILIPNLSGDDPQETISLDQNGISWIGSLNLLCVPLGCLFSGYLTQPLGRRRSMQLVNLPFMAAWMLFHYAYQPWHVFLALALTGVSGGLLEAPTLTYLAEVTTPNLRGVLASTSTVAVILGVLTQFFLGTFLDWRSVALACAALPVLSFGLLFFVPESPYWLISKRKLTQAQQSVAWLKGWVDFDQAEKDFKEIYDHMKNETVDATPPDGQTNLQKVRNNLKLYTKSDFLKPFGLVVLAFILGHFCGMTTMQTYSVAIFATLKAPINKYYATIILGVAEALGCILSSILVHFLGKRKMNFFSLTGTAACVFAVAAYAQTRNIDALQTSVSDVPPSEQTWLPLIFVVGAAFFSHTGIRILPWMLIGEVFYTKIRAPASGFSSAASYLASFLANKTFLSMVDTLTLPGTFWFYGAVSVLGLGTLYWWLPETEGKTLFQITEHFNGGQKLDNTVQTVRMTQIPVKERKGVENSGFEEEFVEAKKEMILRPAILPRLRTIYSRWHLMVTSLTYNHFMDASYVSDVLLTPLFTFVEKCTKTIGTMLVVAVCSLTTSVVLLAYWLGIPHWWAKSPSACVAILLLGHWILLNIAYNYFKACTVPPGYPEGELIPEAVSICKKCVKPKPPRAHHCSVCNRCVLKMDHHCPWLNNCVGHHNHRFFYLYMVWMVVGVVYLVIFGWEVAYDVLYREADLEGHTIRINEAGVLISEPDLDNNPLKRKCIIYMTLLSLGVLVALGCLSIWHGKMISRNETSIEVEINKAERTRVKDFVNPYDLGKSENWRRFLGVVSSREGWLQVLWPSPYHPDGDGLFWPTRS